MSSFNFKHDQILSGDITIKKISHHKHSHKITFNKKNMSDVLMYQLWSGDSAINNSERMVEYISPIKWVKQNFPHPPPLPPPNIPFTPTTVMEIGNDKHVFVINDAKIKNYKVIFYVSSRNISIPNDDNVSCTLKNKLKKLKKIPVGFFTSARFDIDPPT